MALIKNPEMTDKNLEAHRSNGRKSLGATTAEGKERSRAANLRHGYYSQIGDEALAALGEDPALLADLIAGAYEEWQPASGQQAWMVERMARLQWRLQRAERIQISLAANRVQFREGIRTQQGIAVRQKSVPLFDILELLQHAAGRPDYYTPRGYLRSYCEAFGKGMSERQRKILEVLQRLGKPAGWAVQPLARGDATASAERAAELQAGARPRGEEVEPFCDEEWEEVREEDEEVDFPVPAPGVRLAEGAEREELRQELVLRLDLELENLDYQWNPQIAEFEKPLSTIERDVALADLHRHEELMQREEQSCAREFWRLGNSLRKLQERAADGAEGAGPTQAQPNRARADVGARHGMPVQVGPNRVRPGASAAGLHESDVENEGAPGDIDENTASREIASMTDCRESVAEEQFQDAKLKEPATEGDAQVAKEGARAKSQPAERPARVASAA